MFSFNAVKRPQIILFSSVFFLAALASCSKAGKAGTDPHVSDFSDNTTPVVEVYNPVQDQVFTSGDTIKIEGKVTDNSLYRGSIRITNDDNGTILKEQLYEIHGYQLYNFGLSYKTSVSSVSNYAITVQYVDHGLNSGMKTVKVKVNP